jgi:hypothetical protein
MRSGLMGFVRRLVGEHEEYMQAYPPVQNGHRVRVDLLDGA